MSNDIFTIRQLIPYDVFDYSTLISALSAYSKPRDKITKLLAGGSVVRIKKGLYCFGEALRKQLLSREYLANLIYGPSYVSLDYALAFHGFIPERVETVTSVTTGRSHDFSTPIGNFSYRMLTEGRYECGADLLEADGVSFLIATSEKALADKVWTDKRLKGTSAAMLEAYLLEDLRIDLEAVAGFNLERLSTIADSYASGRIHSLVRCVKKLRSHSYA
jgi:predicted transcriptional regulator of viral defense system